MRVAVCSLCCWCALFSSLCKHVITFTLQAGSWEAAAANESDTERKGRRRRCSGYCTYLWSYVKPISPGWITKWCMFASLQSLMWCGSRGGCWRAGTKGKLCWSSLRLWSAGFPNTSVLLSSGCSKTKSKSMVSSHPLTFTAHERLLSALCSAPPRLDCEPENRSEDGDEVGWRRCERGCFSLSESDKRLFKMKQLSVTLPVYLSWSCAGGKYQAHDFKSPQ